MILLPRFAHSIPTNSQCGLASSTSSPPRNAKVFKLGTNAILWLVLIFTISSGIPHSFLGEFAEADGVFNSSLNAQSDDSKKDASDSIGGDADPKSNVSPDGVFTVDSVGIGGYFKLGFWTEIQITVSPTDQVDGTLQIVLPDGDGYDTTYSKPISAASGQSTTVSFVAKFGKANASLKIHLLDESENQVGNQANFQIEEVAKPLRALEEFIVTLGDDIGVKQSLDSRGRSPATLDFPTYVNFDSAEVLSENWFQNDAIDLLAISTSSIDLSESQYNQILQWVQMGGKVIVFGSEKGDELFGAGKPFEKVIKGKYAGRIELPSSSSIETFSQGNRLVDRGKRLPRVLNFKGIAKPYLLEESEIPIIFRQTYGLGCVVICGADVDKAPFVSWNGRSRMLGKILESIVEERVGNRNEKKGGRVSHIGYTDISGQLRRGLDRFQNVSFLAFTLVAVLTILYILCIGPGDYFFLKKVFKRMEYTWLTFVLISLFFSGAAILIFSYTKSDQLAINQIEIVDIDAATKTTRGNMFAHIYSPYAQLVDVQYPASVHSHFQAKDILVSWEGLPGDSLGAMGNSSSNTVFDSSYEVNISKESDNYLGSLVGMPLQNASTKSVSSKWKGTFQSEIVSQLRMTNTAELRGEVTNPLDVPLKDCVILFGSWAYMINGTLDPGEKIRVESDSTLRALKPYLTKRKLVDNQDINKPWSQTSTALERIAEVMMFYEAAGGNNYAKLSHRFHSGLDMSFMLDSPNDLGIRDNQSAVLVGSHKKASHQLLIGGASGDEMYDQQMTFYRIILPVGNPPN